MTMVRWRCAQTAVVTVHLLGCRRRGIFHIRTLSPSDRLVTAWIFLAGLVDLTYTAFLMPLLIIFPTNNTMYSWASPVNLVLGGQLVAHSNGLSKIGRVSVIMLASQMQILVCAAAHALKMLVSTA